MVSCRPKTYNYNIAPSQTILKIGQLEAFDLVEALAE
jgi:hypothetical protein